MRSRPCHSRALWFPSLACVDVAPPPFFECIVVLRRGRFVSWNNRRRRTRRWCCCRKRYDRDGCTQRYVPRLRSLLRCSSPAPLRARSGRCRRRFPPHRPTRVLAIVQQRPELKRGLRWGRTRRVGGYSAILATAPWRLWRSASRIGYELRQSLRSTIPLTPYRSSGCLRPRRRTSYQTHRVLPARSVRSPSSRRDPRTPPESARSGSRRSSILDGHGSFASVPRVECCGSTVPFPWRMQRASILLRWSKRVHNISIVAVAA